MSYIVSKRIPKSCALCDIKPEKCPAIRAKVCRMDEDLWIPLNYRHDGCPLIEIKSPHGRLIDADKLNTYDLSPVNGFCVIGVTEEDIGLAETILKAEGDEE